MKTGVSEFNPDDYEHQLRFAAEIGDINRVRELIAEGVNLNSFDEIGMTALHYAAREEHFAIAKLPLGHGADVNARHEPTNSNTTLANVAETCSLEMAQLLVDAGADPRIRGWMGLDALDYARRRKSADGPAVYQLLARARFPTQSTQTRHADRRNKK